VMKKNEIHDKREDIGFWKRTGRQTMTLKKTLLFHLISENQKNRKALQQQIMEQRAFQHSSAAYMC